MKVEDIAETIYMNSDYFVGKIIRIKDRKELSLEDYARVLAQAIAKKRGEE